MKRRFIILIVFFFLMNIEGLQAQVSDSLRLSMLKENLNRAMKQDSLYAEKMDFSISNMPVSQLIKSIAKASGLNINPRIGEEKLITCNFKQIRIIDILYFICKEYALETELVGNILSIVPYRPPIIEPEIGMSYDSERKEISFDFSRAKLINVAKTFSGKTGINIIIPNQLFEHRVSSFGKAMTVENAVQCIAAVNSLIAQKKNETTWALFQAEEGKSNMPLQNKFSFNADELKIDSLGLISAHITNSNINVIVTDICRRLKKNYFFTDNLDRITGIYVEKVDINTFLKVLFTGTEFTWRIENGIYLFAKANDNNPFGSVKVLPMRYRTVDKVSDVIPADLKKGVEILTFPDLNSLVISGDQRRMMQLVSFITDIDKSVPLISIDVIIVDASDTNTREAGISFGKGKEAATSIGTFSPGIDLTLNANTINRLINSFNGFGSINLGKVGPNFYAGLKLLEENNIVTLRSTPKLSTLNGYKATLKSGETKYYKESQTNIIGTQNPLQSESYQWKNVEANLTLDILPYVSLDSCITLKVDLSQSEFTERELKDSPPGTTNRSFNSIIKVRNQDMVLLGGIERNLTSKISSGLPFIARIPILKWIFGTSSRTKRVQKLNVFIKPTII